MWELIFLMVILKIPIVYLCLVVWWAVKSKPVADGGTGLEPAPVAPGPWGGPHDRRRIRGPRPHGRPTRNYARTRRAGAPHAAR